MKVEIRYMIPVTNLVSSMFTRNKIAIRTNSHIITTWTEITKRREFKTSEKDLAKQYESDGWTVAKTDSGITCSKNGVVNQYRFS